MMEAQRSTVDEELHARKFWWIFIVTGVFWLVLSLVLLRFNATSALTVGLMAGVVALLAGVNEFVTAAWTKDLRWLRIVLGVIFVAVGVVCLVYPGKSFEIIAAVFAWYLLFKGIFDIVRAFMFMRLLTAWWLLLIMGLIELGLGFWAAGYFKGSAVLLVAWVGIGAMIRGITEIVQAFQLRGQPE
jgi:uncharacterized membrane protein HdeD (DUF308 family)